MNLNSQRSWITPLMIGSFLLSAVTGVVIFFHLNIGLVRPAHEWLSWIMVFAVVPHILLNFLPFKRYFSQTIPRWVMLISLVILALSFFSLRSKEQQPEPFFSPVVRALSQAPLPVLAQVAQVPPETLRERLLAAGLPVTDTQQTLAQIVGPDLRKQLDTLRKVLPAAQQP